jgi:hypothetical protein
MRKEHNSQVDSVTPIIILLYKVPVPSKHDVLLLLPIIRPLRPLCCGCYFQHAIPVELSEKSRTHRTQSSDSHRARTIPTRSSSSSPTQRPQIGGKADFGSGAGSRRRRRPLGSESSPVRASHSPAAGRSDMSTHRSSLLSFVLEVGAVDKGREFKVQTDGRMEERGRTLACIDMSPEIALLRLSCRPVVR